MVLSKKDNPDIFYSISLYKVKCYSSGTIGTSIINNHHLQSKQTMASRFHMIAAALFLILANKVTSQTATTIFDFPAFSPALSDLTFQGAAHVNPASTYAQLVNETTVNNSVGRVLYSPPVTFWEPGKQASFQTIIEFTPWRPSTNPYGDGVTFFIAPVNYPIPKGSHGGNFGIFEPQSGLAPSVFAFEFDYYYEGEDAGWDPQYTHIGIDINSRVSRNTTRWIGSLGVTVVAIINYDSSTRTITVLTTVGTTRTSLSYVFDLKTILPQQVQVGISGSTGEGTSSPEVRSWSFTSTLVWDGKEDNAENGEEYIKQNA